MALRNSLDDFGQSAFDVEEHAPVLPEVVQSAMTC